MNPLDPDFRAEPVFTLPAISQRAISHLHRQATPTLERKQAVKSAIEIIANLWKVTW
jgi:hypothetical protein